MKAAPSTAALAPFLLAACLLLPSSSAAPDAPFSLLQETHVDGDGIFLPQILAPNPANPVPHIRLADAPSPTKPLTLSRAQVQDLLQKAAPHLAPASWSGPPAVRVSRRLRPLHEPELLDTLASALQRAAQDRGELELRLTRPWISIPIPDEPFTLKVLELPSTGINSNFILRFELRTAREILGNWQTSVHAKLWRDIPVARSHLKRGDLLAESDLVRQRRDLLATRAALLELPQNVQLELLQNLPPGAPLSQHSFRVKPLIHRGQTLDALVLDGALSISFKVVALEDGLAGQTVRVRNIQTKRELRGKVHHDQTILVSL